MHSGFRGDWQRPVRGSIQSGSNPPISRLAQRRRQLRSLSSARLVFWGRRSPSRPFPSESPARGRCRRQDTARVPARHCLPRRHAMGYPCESSHRLRGGRVARACLKIRAGGRRPARALSPRRACASRHRLRRRSPPNRHRLHNGRYYAAPSADRGCPCVGVASRFHGTVHPAFGYSHGGGLP